MSVDNYKGSRVGAIASGFFVAASSFLVFYLVAVFVVVAPEGATDDTNRTGIVFDLCLVASGSLLYGLVGERNGFLIGELVAVRSGYLCFCPEADCRKSTHRLSLAVDKRATSTSRSATAPILLKNSRLKWR
ncbi:hypothetical protein EAH79_02080 [Sphingomonas koreensis]|nr:hypothetical protein EAH79_02080 [Sphingomonas koreensis]